MPKVEHKENIPEPIGDQISDSYDLIKYAVDIKSKIKSDITADFTLAKLEDDDKKAVKEMTTNAYYIKNILLRSIKKIRKYKFNQEQFKWEKIQDKNTEKYIMDKADELFTYYMRGIFMTVILNRNKAKNPMLNIVGQISQQEEDNGEDKEALKTAIGEAMKENKLKK